MKNIIIIYHGDCSDGFGGAWAAWRKFGDKAEYFGVQHDKSIPEGLVGKEIYFIDFVYKSPEMKKIISENKRVTAIDHHVSATDVVKMTREPLFSIDNSGSVLAWKYFHPSKPVPMLLKYIEDNDIWKFKVPKSKEAFSYLQTINFNFKEWSKLARQLESGKSRKNIIGKGEAIAKYNRRTMERLVAGNVEAVEFEGIKTLAVNSPVLQSDIGDALSKKNPPIGIIWSEADGRIRVSLRSVGTVDVAKLAVKYGGGGHKAAAGFWFPADQSKPWKRL